MALQLGAVRDALPSAGADQELASKAADELAGYDRDLTEVKSELKLIRWMLGTNLVVTLGILWRVLAH